MKFACSLAWRLLLLVALVANPLIGMSGDAHAKATVATEAAPCAEMEMVGDSMPGLSAAGEVGQQPPCHDHGCPDSICGSACEMGSCVGHCVYLLNPVALPVWRGSDANLAPRLTRHARQPLLAPLIRPPIN